MMIEPSILMGVNVPVFALTFQAPRRVVAWNPGMVTMTGHDAAVAMGGSPEALLGRGAEVLQTVDHGDVLRLDQIGAVAVHKQGEVLVCTVSDHEREMFIGLAAQDLRVPLRSIHLLADQAARDGVSADATLNRIKQIARTGMAMAQEVVTCAQAGRGAGAGHRKVYLPSLAHSLLSMAVSGDGHRIKASPVTLLVERGVLQTGLRALIEHAVQQVGADQCHLELQVTEGAGSVEFILSDEVHPLGASGHAFLASGTASGEEGVGLLGVRRLLRSRGGGIALRKAAPGVPNAILMRMPGRIVPMSRGARVA